MSTSTVQPDPSVIGGISKAPFALMPNTARFFQERARRFEGLAQASNLAPYLKFLGGIASLQARLVFELPPLQPLDAAHVERARAATMPPIDRATIASSAELRETVARFIDLATDLDKPVAAQEALVQLKEADEGTLSWMIDNVLADAMPVEGVAHHLYVAAAVQVHLTRLASMLDALRLVPVSIGVCPSCGGKPVGSMIIGVQGAEGARYACCSSCSSMWNEVRVKCIACGSTGGIGYRAVEVEADQATIKAEVCDSCRSWTKILYQNKNPSLEIIADDVASLGLDLLMKDTEYRRAGFDPFLVGY
jgi:FdhE protein